MPEITMNELNNRISQLEGTLKEHSLDFESHPLATPDNAGIIPQWSAINLYSNGGRFRGIGETEIGLYKLSTVSFGSYLGRVSNFSDFPLDFGSQAGNLVAVKIEGYGPTSKYPNPSNYFGSSDTTDSGIFRHITILDLKTGKRIERYMGQIYSGAKDYGWVCSSYWKDGVVSKGTGSIKVRRFFDGDTLTLDISVKLSSLAITNGSGIIKVGELPAGFKISSVVSSNNIYFIAHGQSSAGTFASNMYINTSGTDIQLIANRDIDTVYYRGQFNSSDPFS